MNKKAYNTPVVVITKWISEDVITTSGENVSLASGTLTTDTKNEGICSISYTNIE